MSSRYRAAADHKAPTTKLQKLKSVSDSDLVINVPTKSYSVNNLKHSYVFPRRTGSIHMPGLSLTHSSDQTGENSEP